MSTKDPRPGMMLQAKLSSPAERRAMKSQNPSFGWQDCQNQPTPGETYTRNRVSIHFDDVENCYQQWPTPICIVADGPYGIDGFPGDSHGVESLVERYTPHVKAWTKYSTPQTTLWFWNTEVGWATVHPLLIAQGWEYRACHIWDKGLGHIAGNANTRTLRKFPVVTEVCAQYVKAAKFQVGSQSLSMQEWLRHEWKRTRLPFRLANEACEVRNAATRKYLTADHLWYYPPVDAFVKIARYANTHGDPNGRPYFSIDGERSLSGVQWARLRAKFTCPVGITNVWQTPQVGGTERIQGIRQGMSYKFRSLHGSQKPLKFFELMIHASTDAKDVVWEPFGGLCPGAVVSYRMKRRYYGAEIIPEFYTAAVKRLETA